MNTFVLQWDDVPAPFMDTATTSFYTKPGGTGLFHVLQKHFNRASDQTWELVLHHDVTQLLRKLSQDLSANHDVDADQLRNCLRRFWDAMRPICVASLSNPPRAIRCRETKEQQVSQILYVLMQAGCLLTASRRSNEDKWYVRSIYFRHRVTGPKLRMMTPDALLERATEEFINELNQFYGQGRYIKTGPPNATYEKYRLITEQGLNIELVRNDQKQPIRAVYRPSPAPVGPAPSRLLARPQLGGD